jgi:hypothetical protein
MVATNFDQVFMSCGDTCSNQKGQYRRSALVVREEEETKNQVEVKLQQSSLGLLCQLDYWNFK